MKSKIVFMAVAGLMGLAASADVLYWQVGADSSSYNYDTAYLMARDSDNNLYYVSKSFGEDGTTVVSNDGAVDADQFANGGYALGDLSSIMSWTETGSSSGSAASGWKFYVELWNENTGWVGRSQDMSYDTLVASGAIRDSLSSNFSLNNSVGHGGTTFTSEAPEPTSGLLMLIGLGALALRRKRA